MFEMLPLSPARAWAISRNFIRLDLLVNNLKLNITGGNQDGCNSQHLSDLNPHASSSGGSIGVERFYLVANVLCLSACSVCAATRRRTSEGSCPEAVMLWDSAPLYRELT